MGAPGRNVGGVADKEQKPHSPQVGFGQRSIKLLTACLVKPFERTLDHQTGGAAGEVGEQAEFTGLAGTELAVAPVKQVAHGKTLDQLPVGFDIGQKGAGRGTGVHAVKKIGVVPAQFVLVELLLPAEGNHPGVGRPAKASGPEADDRPPEEVAEPIHAGTRVADAAPGLARTGLEPLDTQAGDIKIANRQHHAPAPLTRPTTP